MLALGVHAAYAWHTNGTPTVTVTCTSTSADVTFKAADVVGGSPGSSPGWYFQVQGSTTVNYPNDTTGVSSVYNAGTGKYDVTVTVHNVPNGSYTAHLRNHQDSNVNTLASPSPFTVSCTTTPPPPPPTATPELGSGDLLIAGLLPIAGVYVYRRRSRRNQATTGDNK